ncbi:GL18311 [Drosophila persimilis]|uniref:GL18311 n=1 Tax=Drosophila persimilis TaxID=7234 RepID=B4H4R5_DROPE|nr:GL18311 [Drosophila persimilis]
MPSVPGVWAHTKILPQALQMRNVLGAGGGAGTFVKSSLNYIEKRHRSPLIPAPADFGTRFIVRGDFNAKHTWWGFRLNNPNSSRGINTSLIHTQSEFDLMSDHCARNVCNTF